MLVNKVNCLQSTLYKKNTSTKLAQFLLIIFLKIILTEICAKKTRPYIIDSEINLNFYNATSNTIFNTENEMKI